MFPLGYWEILGQIKYPDFWEAFKNINLDRYERHGRADDSDELSYLSSQNNSIDGDTICGYTLCGWTWKLLSEVDLHIEGME